MVLREHAKSQLGSRGVLHTVSKVRVRLLVVQHCDHLFAVDREKVIIYCGSA